MSSRDSATCAAAPLARRWPLSSALPPLSALPTAPACARAFVRLTLAGWHLSAMSDTAELIASELVNNAVEASVDEEEEPGYHVGHVSTIRFCLLADVERIVVEVWDEAGGIPRVGLATPDDERGRGLALVEALADQWGWRPATGRTGKCTWAVLKIGT